MCTVFAESEVISLIGKGTPREDIAYGVIESVVMKVVQLIAQVPSDKYFLTGGLCEDPYVISRLEKALKAPVASVPLARYAGAIGAALMAEQYKGAVKNGADCLGVGAMFTTATKAEANVLKKETLRDICAAVDIPVVAIGGIGKNNISYLAGTGVDGVALVSAIFAADDIENECRLLRKLSEEMVNA